ncbi:MAG: hypothetical protein CM15mP65_09550 [Crocinitomicaceae bacterium]|nr:MAG: hypothetical protein CM15mP65_09550 [Crocinitomicaceae bacterium]
MGASAFMAAGQVLMKMKLFNLKNYYPRGFGTAIFGFS